MFLTIVLTFAGALLLFAIIRSLEKGPPAVVDVDEDIDIEAFRDTVISVPAPPPITIPAPASAPENIPTMAQFQTAYDIVRKHEGGYQKMPEDSGNYNSRSQLVGTNWGINAQVYESYLKRPPTEQDMRNMPRHVALAIFKQLYWDRVKGDQLRDQQVANILFDGHVNHGKWGIQMMQQALGITRDGVVGPQTLAAINNANPFTLFNEYKRIRRAGYHDLVRRRPKDERFLRGWLIRIDSFVYQGGGLMFPTSSGGQGQPPAATPDGDGGGVVVAVIAVAVAAYLFA